LKAAFSKAIAPSRPGGAAIGGNAPSAKLYDSRRKTMDQQNAKIDFIVSTLET
jgi:hypothetical protein